MKKFFILLLCLLHLPTVASAKLKVVTTTTDLASLASEVGGNYIETKSLTQGSQDPHYIEPKPSYARILNQADLFIQIGLSLEIGWVPPLLTQARNPKILPGQAGHLQASDGLTILEIPTGNMDRSQGDIHPEGNPHYWLDPRHGIIIAKNIADRLSTLDPEHAAQYQLNYQNFQKKLQSKILEWKTKASVLKGKEIITYHKSFVYFANFTGLNIQGYIEPKAGIPPSPAHLISLIEMIQRKKIPVIVIENYYSPKSADKVAKEAGIKVLILPTSVGSDDRVQSYIELFDLLITEMVGVL